MLVMNKSIGIVGGAGPHAGALLLEKIIQVCQETYGYQKDVDFPFMMLLNIPFCDMLDNPDEERVSRELEEALALLETNGMDRVAIACNTLHGFLPEKKWNFEFVDLRSVVQDTEEEILILCTSTSRARGVYSHLKKGVYLPPSHQQQLDRIIDRILAGKVDRGESSLLSALIQQENKRSLILGCTELSLLHTRFPLILPAESVIEPLQLLAKLLCS